MQLSRGESPRDTALVLSRYVHAIAIRTGPHAIAEGLAEHSSVPVVNMLTADHHPCQALADLMTLRERFGDLSASEEEPKEYFRQILAATDGNASDTGGLPGYAVAMMVGDPGMARALDVFREIVRDTAAENEKAAN